MKLLFLTLFPLYVVTTATLHLDYDEYGVYPGETWRRLLLAPTTFLPEMSTTSTLKLKTSGTITTTPPKESYTVTCNQGHYAERETCYKIMENETDWETAKLDCQSIKKGHLAVINDIYDFDWLRQLLNRTEYIQKSFWLGFYIDEELHGKMDHLINKESEDKKLSKLETHWVKENLPTYPRWWTMKPNTTDGYCGLLHVNTTESSLWHLENCKNKLPYICEYPANVSHTHVPSGCIYTGWTAYGNSCYKFYGSEAKTWMDAENTCISVGGHLIAFTSSEQEILRRNIFFTMKYNKFWFGYYIEANGSRVVNSMESLSVDITKYPKFLRQFFFVKDGILVERGPVLSPYSTEEYVLRENSNQYCSVMDARTFAISRHTCDAYLPFICERKPEPLRLNFSPPKVKPDEYCEGSNETKKWLKFQDSCYRIVSKNASFLEARIECAKEKSLLVSIESHEENYFLTSKIWRLEDQIGLWIAGFYDRQKETFFWHNQKERPLNYVNWDYAEPNNRLNMERCMIMYTRRSGFWNDVVCSNQYGFICEKSSDDPLEIPSIKNETSVSGGCPESWKKMGNRCVRLVNYDKLDEDEASLKCTRNHELAELVSIHSAKEQAFLETLISSHMQSLWIGYRIVGYNRKFLWRDFWTTHRENNASYTNWALNEPRDPANNDCVAMVADGQFGKWINKECNEKYGYICQMPLDPKIEESTLPITAMCSAPYESFYYFEGECYLYVPTPKTWQDANLICQEENSELVSVLDRGELAFLWTQFQDLTKEDVWIGLKKQKKNFTINRSSVTEESFSNEWSDQWPVIYENWDPNLNKSDTKEEKCVSMSMRESWWQPSYCSLAKPFLCKHTKVSYFPSREHRMEGQCIKGWFDFGSEYCYYLESDSELKTWQVANDLCKIYGADVISIHSQHEMRIMQKIAQNSAASIWLGLLRDSTSGDFVEFGWSDGTPFNYANWNSLEPNNMNEVCVEMITGSGKWNDLPCTVLRRVICKMQKVSKPGSTQKLKQFNPKLRKRDVCIGEIIAIILGLILIAILLGRAFYFFYNWRRKNNKPIYGFDNVIYNSQPSQEPTNVVLGEDQMGNTHHEFDSIINQEENTSW